METSRPLTLRERKTIAAIINRTSVASLLDAMVIIAQDKEEAYVKQGEYINARLWHQDADTLLGVAGRVCSF